MTSPESIALSEGARHKGSASQHPIDVHRPEQADGEAGGDRGG